MAPKRLLSIVTACLLGAVGVLSIEQKQNQKHYANAYLAQEARMAEFNAAWREPEDDEDFVAIRLFSEPHYQGSYCSINYQHLRGGYCGEYFFSLFRAGGMQKFTTFAFLVEVILFLTRNCSRPSTTSKSQVGHPLGWCRLLSALQVILTSPEDNLVSSH